MKTLDDFGTDSTPLPPKCERKAIIQSPIHGKIAGFVCKELNRPMKVYTTRRFGSHYYRNGDGYAISDSILRKLRRYDIPRVFVHDGHGERDHVWEFQTRQYIEEGKSVPSHELQDESDPQTYVPLDEYLYLWEGRADDLFRRTFSEAVERIGWRGYDPRKRARADG